MARRSMNELEQVVQSTLGAPQERGLAPAQSAPMTFASMDAQLGGQMVRPDMGFIKNFQADRHAGREQLETYKKVTSERYGQLRNLAVDAIKAEVSLIREQLKVSWNHQYAALAERAAAGEVTVIRKLQGLLDAARDLLLEDRNTVVTRLEARHAAGELSDRDFAEEMAYVLDRYRKLRTELIDIVDERRTAVRSAYRFNEGEHK